MEGKKFHLQEILIARKFKRLLHEILMRTSQPRSHEMSMLQIFLFEIVEAQLQHIQQEITFAIFQYILHMNVIAKISACLILNLIICFY
jgi:hypothetical protein